MIKMSEMIQLKDGTMADKRTGEILDSKNGCFMYIPFRDKLKEDWFMAFSEAFKSLAKDRDLRGEPRSILDYLFSILSFENFIAIEQSHISKDLNIDKANVSKSIKILIDKGILEKGPKIGKTWSYKLNPFYAWKGSVKNLQDARKKHLKVVKDATK